MTHSQFMKTYALYRQRFAGSPGVEYGRDLLAIPDYHNSDVSIRRGYTPPYSSSSETKFVRRGETNYLFKIVADMYDYIQHGGLLTFDEEVSRYIGGYPKGAILNYYKISGGSSDVFMRVMSLKDNNMDNFVKDPGYIDGKSWTGLQLKIFPYWEKMEFATPDDNSSWTAPYDGWCFINGNNFQCVVIFITHHAGKELPKKIKVAETTYLNVLRHGTTVFASQFLCSKGDRFQFELLPYTNRANASQSSYMSYTVSFNGRTSRDSAKASKPILDIAYCPTRV